MDYEAFASDLPAEHRMTFTSAEENEETLHCAGVRQEMRQTGCGSFRADLAIGETPSSTFFSDRFNTELAMSLEPPEGMVSLMVLHSAERDFVVCGQSVTEDQLLFWPARSDARILAPGLGGSDSLVLTEDRFQEAAEAISPGITWPETLTVINGRQGELRPFRCSLVDQVNRSEPKSETEDTTNLVASLIAWTADSLEKGRAQPLVTNVARASIARRAQECMEGGFQEEIHLEDLCRVTGVGLRTLQRCFREHLDLSITQYLLSVRLHAAHCELWAAEPQEDTVTEIALRNGFTHLGRFSVAFRERFGESPRETLARPARASVSLAA